MGVLESRLLFAGIDNTGLGRVRELCGEGWPYPERGHGLEVLVDWRCLGILGGMRCIRILDSK